MTDLRWQKLEMRQAMKERRAKAHKENPDAPQRLRDIFMKSVTLPPGKIVASYKAFGSEIDPAPLAEALRATGCLLALPAVVAKGLPLQFHLYKPGDPLAVSNFGVEEPLPVASVVEPDILLVPLLAFDQQLYRLGYGSGYYDRTLEQLRTRKQIIAFGLGFSCQEAPEVPKDGRDARLDKIVTEIQVFSR